MSVLTARALASVREEASHSAPTARWTMLCSGPRPDLAAADPR
jgi:hypothetical protein